MSTLPIQLQGINEQYGPHLAFNSGLRLETGIEPDKIVNTHCCFCGQQCGIKLKVKDNVVIGFEPWEDFPFNQGMLCPKGVKRYLQGAHPDRLTTALQRDPAAAGGFRSLPYAQAIQRVAAEIERIQSTYGNEAFGLLSGASLTVEKAYLMGKFARVALKTPFIDYNGRLCMVSAAAGNKKAFGIDRAAALRRACVRQRDNRPSRRQWNGELLPIRLFLLGRVSAGVYSRPVLRPNHHQGPGILQHAVQRRCHRHELRHLDHFAVDHRSGLEHAVGNFCLEYRWQQYRGV